METIAGRTYPPKRQRRFLIAFAMALAIVTYIDRISIAQAQPLIARDLNLDKIQMGMVFSAFGWAYCAFELPSGLLGDRIGSRNVLTRIVLWWSFFTAATGQAWNFTSLVVMRALFGIGEAGAFPNINRTFSLCLPPAEQNWAQGFLWLAARWGGAFTPYLVVFVLRYTSWRTMFFLFALLGVVWAVWFYIWFRDTPGSEAPAHPPDVPWKAIFTSRRIWLLLIPYFTSSYGWWFYITWLPSYLREARHVELEQGALLAGLPLFMGGLGSFFCGGISGSLTKYTGSVGATRRMMAYIGYTAAAILLVVAARLENPLHAMLAMGAASFANDLVMPGAWGACTDLGGKYAGTVSGAMAGFGNAGGAVSPLIIGFLLQWTNNDWNLCIYISAAVYFLGTICWAFLDPVTPLITDEGITRECH